MQHPVYSKIPLRISDRFPIPRATIRPPQRIKPTRVLSRTYFQKLQTSVDPRIPVSPLLTLWTLFGERRLRCAFATVWPAGGSFALSNEVPRGRQAWRAGAPLGLEARRGKSNGSGRLPARGKGGRAPLPREFSASKKLRSASQGVQLPLPVVMIPLTPPPGAGYWAGRPPQRRAGC